MPFGVGPGQYAAYDATHTASHSLMVEILAEDGVLAVLAVLLLLLFVVRVAVRFVSMSDLPTDADLLRIAAVAGAGAFLLHGVIAGVPLALGTVNVWATLLWLQVGLAGSPCLDRSSG